MSKPLIKLQNVSAGYSSNNVLDNVTLTIERDDFLGIIGPNGGGKTTLLNVILGLLKPTSGHVEYFDADGNAVSSIRIGYLPQYNKIDKKFPISVREVVSLGLAEEKSNHLHNKIKGEIQERTRQTMVDFNLEDIADCHIGSLSGGQIQRVLLARAVVSQPEVIVLDEPNTYVDLRFQSQTYRLLHQINSECAVVVVGHDVDVLLRNARRVALVNETVRVCEMSEVSPELVNSYFME